MNFQDLFNEFEEVDHRISSTTHGIFFYFSTILGTKSYYYFFVMIDKKSIEIPLLLRILGNLTGNSWKESQQYQQQNSISLLSQPEKNSLPKSLPTVSSWNEFAELTYNSLKSFYELFHLAAEMLMSYKSEYTPYEVTILQQSNSHDLLISHCVGIIDILDTLIERFSNIYLLFIYLIIYQSLFLQ